LPVDLPPADFPASLLHNGNGGIEDLISKELRDNWLRLWGCSAAPVRTDGKSSITAKSRRR